MRYENIYSIKSKSFIEVLIKKEKEGKDGDLSKYHEKIAESL